MRKRTILSFLSVLAAAMVCVWYLVIRPRYFRGESRVVSEEYVQEDSPPIEGYALYPDATMVGNGPKIEFRGYFATAAEAKKRCDSLDLNRCHYIEHKKAGKEPGFYVYAIDGVSLENVGRYVMRNPGLTDVYMRLN